MKRIWHGKSAIRMTCIILCSIIILILALNNIPIQAIFPVSSEQYNISNMRIEIDKGEQGDSEVFKIEDESKIQQIEKLLSPIRLSFSGVYDGIEYCTYEGDWIIRISSDKDNVFFIRENGEVYSENFKFTSSKANIKKLYDMVISWSELDK